MKKESTKSNSTSGEGKPVIEEKPTGVTTAGGLGSTGSGGSTKTV